MKIKRIIRNIVIIFAVFYTLNFLIPNLTFINFIKDKYIAVKHELSNNSIKEIEIPSSHALYRNESNLNNNGGALETDDFFYIVTDNLVLEKRDKNYKLDETFKVTSDRYSIGNLQILGDYLFYTSDGIHRVKLDGSNHEKLFSGGATNLYVTPKWIYFVNYKNGMKLYRMDINSQELKIISDKRIMDLLYDEGIFYANIENDSSYDIVTLNTDGYITSTLLKDDFAHGMIKDGDMLYYRNGVEHFIKSLNLKTSQVKELVKENVTYYALNEEYIYYSTRDIDSPSQDDTGVYQVNRASSKVITLDDITTRPSGAILLLGEDIIIESDYKKHPFDLIRINENNTYREYLSDVLNN